MRALSAIDSDKKAFAQVKVWTLKTAVPYTDQRRHATTIEIDTRMPGCVLHRAAEQPWCAWREREVTGGGRGTAKEKGGEEGKGRTSGREERRRARKECEERKEAEEEREETGE